MATETIREFLVEAGFRINRTQQKQFKNGIEDVTKAVKALAAALLLKEAAEKFVALNRMFEDLYYASQRLNTSATNIRGFGFALSQVGGDAKGARASLEGIASFMRNTPAGESIIRSWGVQTKDTNGRLRETTDIANDLGAMFRSLNEHGQYYLAHQRAGMLGMDEQTMQALMRGDLTKSMDDYRRKAAQVGVNVEQAAKAGHDFMVAMRDVGAYVQLFAEKMALLAEGPVASVVAWWRGVVADGTLAKLQAAIASCGVELGKLGETFGGLFQNINLGREILPWATEQFKEFAFIIRAADEAIQSMSANWQEWKAIFRGDFHVAGLYKKAARAHMDASNAALNAAGASSASYEANAAVERRRGRAGGAVDTGGGDDDAAIRTIATEARRNSRAMGDVAHVILNRMTAHGASASEIVKSRGQFEVWANGRAGRVDPNSPEYKAALAAWNRAKAEQAAGVDPTGRATHFYSPSGQAAAHDGRALTPKFARLYPMTAERDGHRFYRGGFPGETHLGGSGGGRGGVTINQKTEVTVNGSGDPTATGKAVVAQQNRVNANLVRYAKPVVQ